MFDDVVSDFSEAFLPGAAPLKLAAPEQVFDVLPIRGYLQPGEEEIVEVSYFAQANSRIAATAVCEVEGGPSYDVELSADAAGIRYSLDATTVNFGSVVGPDI